MEPPGSASAALPLREDTRLVSALVLVAANLLPLYGVLAWDWSAFHLLLVYWIELVVIGLVSLLKMLFWYVGSLGMWLLKLLLLPFLPLFLIPYFIAVACLGALTFGVFGSEEIKQAFVSLLFAWNTYGVAPMSPEVAVAVLQENIPKELFASTALLAASHAFSFLWNFLWKGEYRRIGLGALVLAPIVRVWLTITAMAIGMTGIQFVAYRSPALLLAGLVVVKTGLDLLSHWRVHAPPRATRAS